MKIKLLCSRAGADFAQNRGDEIEVEQAEAVRMIEAGQAVPVRSGAPVEIAVKSPAAETSAIVREELANAAPAIIDAAVKKVARDKRRPVL